MLETQIPNSFFSRYRWVLKRNFLVLYGVLSITTFFDQWLIGKIESLISSPQGLGSEIWIFGAISLITGMLFPIFHFLILAHSMSTQTRIEFLKEKLSFAMIESMRAWGKTMLWSFLLIIPGIIQFLRLIWVNFIVCFDPIYWKGEVDALQRSARLSRGSMMKILGLLFVFSILVPVLMTSFDDYKLISENPLSGLLLCGVEALIQALFFVLMFGLFKKRIADETHI